MKQKGVIISVLVAAALVALAVSRNGKTSAPFTQSLPQGTPVLPELSQGDTLNGIGKIELIYPSATVTVQRIDGLWRAPNQAGYPVRFDAVADFLRGLARLRIGQVVTVNPDQLPELGLSSAAKDDSAATYTHILLYDQADKPVADLTLGKFRTGDSASQSMYGPDGRYAKAGDVVSVITEAFYSLPRSTLNWMDTTILDAPPDTLIEITAQEIGQEPLTFSRDASSNRWISAAFNDETPLDDVKVARLSELFNRLIFADVLARDESKLKEYGLETPTLYTARTKDGKRLTLRVGRAQPATGNRYALAELEAFSSEPTPTEEAVVQLRETTAKNEQLQKWVYLIPAYRLNGVYAHKDDYVKGPEPAPANPPPVPESAPAIPPAPDVAP